MSCEVWVQVDARGKQEAMPMDTDTIHIWKKLSLGIPRFQFQPHHPQFHQFSLFHSMTSFKFTILKSHKISTVESLQWI